MDSVYRCILAYIVILQLVSGHKKKNMQWACWAFMESYRFP